ncbi:hypothetical protein [Pseudomonas putida]|uniref:hypothetical protein n=1 Tax=Pseudomonas putida TaxID=303 RepID=UPI001E5CD931|nr:hypothetical protein [Pseudomonas putida]MCE0972105.1 hypothetical protein [Pseudomonas putida]
MNPVKTIVAGLLGVMLIFLGVELSIARPFETVYAFAENPAWGFGPRELAHCVGFAGCTLGFSSLMRSFSSQSGRRMNFIAAIGGLCMYPVFLRWPEWMPFTIDYGLRKFICTIGIPFYLLGTLLILRYVKDWPMLTEPLPAALMSGGGMWLWSISWELGVQPFESVYGGSPRGYIQWAQLISDFIGIWTPVFVLATCVGWSPVRKKNRFQQHGKSPR